MPVAVEASLSPIAMNSESRLGTGSSGEDPGERMTMPENSEPRKPFASTGSTTLQEIGGIGVDMMSEKESRKRDEKAEFGRLRREKEAAESLAAVSNPYLSHDDTQLDDIGGLYHHCLTCGVELKSPLPKVDETPDFRYLVCCVYSFHDPDKLPDVDKILMNGGDINPRAPEKIEKDLRST